MTEARPVIFFSSPPTPFFLFPPHGNFLRKINVGIPSSSNAEKNTAGGSNHSPSGRIHRAPFDGAYGGEAGEDTAQSAAGDPFGRNFLRLCPVCRIGNNFLRPGKASRLISDPRYTIPKWEGALTWFGKPRKSARIAE